MSDSHNRSATGNTLLPIAQQEIQVQSPAEKTARKNTGELFAAELNNTAAPALSANDEALNAICRQAVFKAAQSGQD